MRAIVTGGAGFIGSHVAERLVAAGHDVLVLDDLTGGFRDNIPPGARFAECSITDTLDEIFGSFGPEVVYHLAAYAAEGLSHHVPLFNYTNNLTGTVNVLSTAYRARAEHFVFASSIAVYGHPPDASAFTERTPAVPVDPYGIAKLACEQHIKSFAHYFGGPSYTIFRPHNVFGPKQNLSDPYRNVVGIFMARALERRPMPVFGDGSQTRSFSYIDVVAEAIARAPDVTAVHNATMNIGGDEALSVRELARMVAKIMGVPDSVEFLPQRNEVQHAHCEHALARSVFADVYARCKVDIPEGLSRMASYVKSRPIPPPTDLPATVEITDKLPPSWATRLSVEQKR